MNIFEFHCEHYPSLSSSVTTDKCNFINKLFRPPNMHFALHPHLGTPGWIRVGQCKVINICLTYWSKCATGKWKVRSWPIKSKRNTNSDKMWLAVPSTYSPKALLRERLASVNYSKICEVTWALRPIRFKASGHQRIYHSCTSQEHVSGQRKTAYKTSIATHRARKKIVFLPKIHYAWFVMRWGDSVALQCSCFFTCMWPLFLLHSSIHYFTKKTYY